ncbi:ornithine carbamoyltransferase [Cereibacter sphaeroides]|uniref:Ornithine carbamoyltransferase n=1 Tax=Cereibacter sphaeroides TaxID=1063 RepID=A0AAX1ULH3_CERSP|nr:ornithine carbamoyltransferase [Cereibacter sphaeroides]
MLRPRRAGRRPPPCAGHAEAVSRPVSRTRGALPAQQPGHRLHNNAAFCASAQGSGCAFPFTCGH